MRIGLSLGINRRQGAGGYVPEAAALFAREVTTITPSRKAILNTFISTLVDEGLWDLMDILYVPGAFSTSDNAVLNFKSSSYTLVPQNSPAFTADEGFTGNGTSSYLSTGFTPTLHATIATQDDVHLGAWTRLDRDGNEPLIGAEATSAGRALNLYPKATGNFGGRLHDSTGSGTIGAVADSIGHFVMSRTSSTVVRGFKNASVVGQRTGATSGGVTDKEILLLRISPTYSANQIAAMHYGGRLSDAQVLTLYTAFDTLFDAVAADSP